MDTFNLKKRQSRKKLFFDQNNILSSIGEKLINSKINFIKKTPCKLLNFGDQFITNKFLDRTLLIKDFDELKNNTQQFEAFISNFDLQILINQKKLLHHIYNSLKRNGFFCFNLITNNSFVTLIKIFYEIDVSIFDGAYRRFGPLYEIQDIIEKLNKNNFKETVVSTEYLELNYDSLTKMREDFKKFGISNYYKDKLIYKKDFYIKSNRIFEHIIKKNNYFPIELEIATFTTWK